MLAAASAETQPADRPIEVERPDTPVQNVRETSSALEDGELNEHQEDASSSSNELHVQLSRLEYAALEDRFKRLERQHMELQDLASAYSDVIRGSTSVSGQNVSIDQLQAEAGRDGLRVKALEADVLTPLIREAGGIQALVSQTNAMQTLVDKAGGLRELEQFVSDLRMIRDTLDELKGSRGLVDLASDVRGLLQSEQKYTRLQSEVEGPDGLRTKAARYERLVQAFSDVQTVHSLQKSALGFPMPQSATSPTNMKSAPNFIAMNPARARMINARPIEDDPDRDLYEAPPPVAQPCNKTGSNNTPLGSLQIEAAAQSVNQTIASFSKKKRKGSASTTSSVAAKRPTVNLNRASALVQASLPKAVGYSVIRTADKLTGTVIPTARNQSAGGVNGTIKAKSTVYRPQVQKAMGPLMMPDWMRSDVHFGHSEFTATAGARTPKYSSSSSGPDVEFHAHIRSGPVRLPENDLGLYQLGEAQSPEDSVESGQS